MGYAHQRWLTEDHRYFQHGRRGDEVKDSVGADGMLIWDVADRDDPLLLKEHFAETEANDHKDVGREPAVPKPT